MYTVQNSKGTKRYLAKTFFLLVPFATKFSRENKTHFASDLSKHAFFKSMKLFYPIKNL